MALRVAFFGTPAFAVPTLEHLVNSHHAVVGVITQPDRPRGQSRNCRECHRERRRRKARERGSWNGV